MMSAIGTGPSPMWQSIITCVKQTIIITFINIIHKMIIIITYLCIYHLYGSESYNHEKADFRLQKV